MNYITEINAFRNHLKTNPLEAITQALWYVIIDYHNSCNWERWITIDNQRLMAELSISEKTLIKHRNKLIQAGLLEYKSQQRKKSSGKYKLLSFESREVGKEQTAEKSTPDKKVDNETTVKNTADGKAERKAVRGADEKADCSDLDRLDKTRLDINTSTTTEHEENIFDKEFSELAKLYQQVIGEPNALTADWIVALKSEYGFEWTKNAMLESERQGKRSKKYVEGILRNWKVGGGMKLSTDQDKIQNTVQAKKTKFHNFKQRSDKYSEDQLEAIAERKRQEYIDKLKKQSEAF